MTEKTPKFTAKIYKEKQTMDTATTLMLESGAETKEDALEIIKELQKMKLEES